MVEIKRFRFVEQGESTDHHSIDMANALVLLSQSEEDVMSMNHRHQHQHKRVFECKTCSKQFSSFQALGGHRASHKKPRLADVDDRDRTQIAMSKPKLHECSICGLEFAIGQALGGHMRRHRASNDQGSSNNGKRGLCLDLNLAPSGDHINTEGPELELGLELGLGLGHVHGNRTPTLVEFFH